MWKKNEAISSILIRSAITDNNGIVGSDQFSKVIDYKGPELILPKWVTDWSKAESLRIWPPEI